MPTVTHIGGPTGLIRYAGLTVLTDPTFSPPGEYAGGLVKTTGPAVGAAELPDLDLVLVSHDHHSDNLDPAGRELLAGAGRVLTTTAGAARLGGKAAGLEPWQSNSVGGMTVTAVPALHGPPGSEDVTGPVIGFVLTAPEHPSLYISGDNASLGVVEEIREKLGPLNRAVLFAGGVQLAHRFDGAYLTLSADLAALAAIRLEAPRVAVVHNEGWTHFTQTPEQTRAAFQGQGIADRLVKLEPGVPTEL
ncbi:MAG: MBL fold metallo-hydrolase [Solirubrobacterales bacterium]|nr:MBL fold metallo-hydrolase [Solirubrobacterales bacterium]